MSDSVLFGSVVGCVVFAGFVAFALFHTFYGLHDSLKNAQVGKVYNFIYEQPLHGEPERFMAKVLDVHVLSDESIRRLNAKSRYRKYDDNFFRTNHLVTAQTFDGKIRNFYAERTRNVRRPLLGGVVFKSGLASLLF
jgi:hypothetical protein